MATNYMTTEDLNRLGIKWRERDGALVPAARVGLHPEEDARLAAATGSGPATVYRIEASVTNGPRFALTGTLAEIDARLRSGSVGVDVATGATGKASEWPAVAEKMRTEWARTMAAASGTAAATGGTAVSVGSTVEIADADKRPLLAPAPTRINSITVVRGNRTETHTFDAVTVRSGDKVSAECDADGKWTARVKGAAPGSYARAQAVDFTGAGATLTDRYESVKAIRDAVTERMQAKESQRTKPATLAAGQVWMCGDTQWILDEQEPKHPSFWNARTSIGQRGLLSVSTVMGMRYLGTREEVAARESAITDRPVYSESICRPVYGVGPDPIGRDAGPSARAMRVGAAVAEGMARGVAMGLSRTPLGTMTGAPAPAGPYRSAPAREPEPFALPSGAALDGVALAHYDMTRDGGETDEAFRARIVETLNDYRDRGTRPWFQRRIARALRVSPEVIDLDESTPFVVKVRTRDNCVPMSRLAEACDAMREHMPCGVTVVASHYVSPLAALRAEIDRLIAADSGPFAHARAAALRSRAEDPACAQALDPAATLEILRDYERKRGGHRTPNAAALDLAGMYIGTRTVATYERERARSDVYARPARY